MSEPERTSQDRRDFFRAFARNSTAALLGVGGVWMARRNGSPVTGIQECINQGVCPGCSVFNDCGLPRALSTKRAQARREVDHG